MALIQNEDNKCPTTKQVNDALESIGGGGLAQSLPVSLHGVPLANVFTLYVGINSTALTKLSINKAASQKWIASTLSNS